MHAYHITNLYVSNIWLYKPCTAVHAKQTIIYKVLLLVVETAVSPNGRFLFGEMEDSLLL